MRLLLSWLVAAAASLALLELGTALLVEAGWLETPAPRYDGTGFWRGHHPDFGVWHEPNARIRHQRDCFDVSYETNSVGARDVERPVHAETPRVVVLGDSFVEGWGLAANQRLSNRLERATGMPHLNFGMAHFGPYQELIVYEKLASRFDHAAVIATVAPVNDFKDLSLERASAMDRYEYRYRPYLVGEPPDFEHFDHREPALRRTLRRYSYAFNAALAALAALRADPDPGEADREASPRRSLFYDFTPREGALLDAVLERLAAAAGGRPAAVVLIPTERDLERRSVSGPDPLSERLRSVAERTGLHVVNLLPAMAERSLQWQDYFLPCDFHWSARGNAVAAEIVRDALAGSIYPDLQTSSVSKTTETR